MKYSPKNYAQAFVGALDAGVAEAVAVRNLKRSLSKNGDLARFAKVAIEIEKLMVRANGGHLVEVEFARAQSPKTREKVLSQFSKKDRVLTKVVPNLIAGVRIVQDGEEELDLSLSGKLSRLFA